MTRILQEVQDPENPNALTLLSIALSSTFRSLVQLCSGSFLSDEDFQDGALNAMMLKEAFNLIDEAFAIFDINQNGLIELHELQEFWELVKVAGGGTLESLFSEKVRDDEQRITGTGFVDGGRTDILQAGVGCAGDEQHQHHLVCFM